MEADFYLGLDFGGTKLLLGEADSSGRVRYEEKYDSGYMNQREALSFITQSLDDYFAKGRRKPLAMGLGVVGRADSSRGIWFEMDTERKDAVPIAEILSQRYGIACYIDNDVRSAAKAEQRFGFGKNSDNFIYINVGTGIAAGTVSGGKILVGGHYNAGEVGHTHSGIEAGIQCVCGRMDCAEALASGKGLDNCARLYAKRFANTALNIPKEGKVDARDIFRLAQTDELCAFLAAQAARVLANLIMNLVRVSDPDTVVLGGGVVADGFLLPLIKENLNPGTMRYVTNGVVLTRLDPKHIGLIGACTVAMNL
ncbi:MAG: ROK family protein [Clostridiales bacterium]|jgi:predicted NBD/HSP70 family sugar kinase|nr:ROK family protein [Clostridiales bacterium]